MIDAMQDYSNLLIIVESPAKAKAISQYIKSKNVIASYGHIRQLVSKSGSVLPEEDFKMVWESTPKSDKNIENIVKKAKEIQKSGGTILLATDMDREGQGIAQHLANLLNENKIKAPVKRIIFEEITKNKILQAISNPTEINRSEVDAYFARIGLDYLIGFHISPILWRKAKGCRSAGRVQSAVLRAIIEREYEIIKFKPEPYWTLHAQIQINKHKYEADLHEYEGKQLEKFMWTAQSVEEAREKLEQDKYTISKIEEKPTTKMPNPPFTTSTLHQEASSKLGWKSSKTARVAQTLYEGIDIGGSITGLVTYIRTDSVRLAPEASTECATLISKNFGAKYSKPRQFKDKSDSVQGAHEAIRPTNFNLTPDSLKIGPDEAKLYELIWRRAVASQMAEAKFNVTNVFISGAKGVWKIHGREQLFDGFLRVYADEEEKVNVLKDIKQGDTPNCKSVEVKEHVTQPKPRFSEASLIKHMDAVGIGRPSTYSSTIEVLEARGYIERSNKRISPLSSAWVVTGFLDECCSEYIQDEFTAGIEDELDRISSGSIDWKEFLRGFWDKFTAVLNKMSGVNAQEVLRQIGQKYQEYFFKSDPEGPCPKCNVGKKTLCASKEGVFIGCSNYPNCELTISVDQEEPNVIGIDPDSGEEILMRSGKYGPYLHWKNARKSVSIVPAMVKNMSFELAMMLKELPKDLGEYEGKPVKLNTGRFGPYVLYDGKFVSCKKLDITLDDAVKFIKRKMAKTP